MRRPGTTPCMISLEVLPGPSYKIDGKLVRAPAKETAWWTRNSSKI
jgi:hypothetical protein